MVAALQGMTKLVYSIPVNNIGRIKTLVNLNHSFEQQILDCTDKDDKYILVVVLTLTSP